MTWSITEPMVCGSKYGIDQPPWVNPPSVSSSRPPGACTTPSKLMKSLRMICIATPSSDGPGGPVSR
ncbi:MAG: hypothetical protein ACRDSL_17395 [Pseudonocardiaceae bacterium]